MDKKRAGNRRATLTAVVATRNEEAAIGACLRALSFADEIIVVDSGSTDRTVEIARPAARVISCPTPPEDWTDAVRNAAIEQAAGDWILVVDADERPSPGLQAEIEALLRNGADLPDGFRTPIANYMFGKHLTSPAWWPLSGVRLFRRGRGRYPEALHRPLQLRGAVGRLTHPLLHDGYPTVESFVTKMNRYTTRAARAYAAGKSDASGLRPQAIGRVGWWRLLGDPLGAFLRWYVRLQGYRDGLHGLVVSILMAFYFFCETAKVWELQHSRENPS